MWHVFFSHEQLMSCALHVGSVGLKLENKYAMMIHSSSHSRFATPRG